MDGPVPGDPADLTAEWLGDALAEATAFRGATIRAVRVTVIGEGFGLDGTVARLDLGTSGPSTPSCVVAKLAKAARGRDEIRFYETIAPEMPIRLAGYYAGRIDEASDRAVLLIECISPAEQGDVLGG